MISVAIRLKRQERGDEVINKFLEQVLDLFVGLLLVPMVLYSTIKFKLFKKALG